MRLCDSLPKNAFLCNQLLGEYGGFKDLNFGYAGKILVNVDNLNIMKGPFALSAPANIGILAVSAVFKDKSKLLPVSINSMTAGLRNKQEYNLLVQPLSMLYVIYDKPLVDGTIAHMIGRDGTLWPADMFLNAIPNDSVLNKTINVVGAYETLNLNFGGTMISPEQYERILLLSETCEIVASENIETRNAQEFKNLYDLTPIAPFLATEKQRARIWHVLQTSASQPLNSKPLEIEFLIDRVNTQILATKNNWLGFF